MEDEFDQAKKLHEKAVQDFKDELELVAAAKKAVDEGKL